MPERFDRCKAEGGRIRTITLSKGRYFHVCYDKAGKSHKGETKTKKGK